MKRSPFPENMKGTYAEIKIDENYSIFIEVYSVRYDLERIQKDKEREIFECTELSSYIKLLNGIVDESIDNIYFLYKFVSYKANSQIKDAWLFNESITDYSQTAFTNLNLLLDHLNEKFGLNISNFVTIDKTNLP